MIAPTSSRIIPEVEEKAASIAAIFITASSAARTPRLGEKVQERRQALGPRLPDERPVHAHNWLRACTLFAMLVVGRRCLGREMGLVSFRRVENSDALHRHAVDIFNTQNDVVQFGAVAPLRG